MQTKFIEAAQDLAKGPNWGKFMLGRFTPEEWAQDSAFTPGWGLIRTRGWDERHLLVLDLQTGEGAIFLPGGKASADLDKHQVWVCPLFQPFLEWLYTQDLTDLEALPSKVALPEAPFAMTGYRRPGPEADK